MMVVAKCFQVLFIYFYFIFLHSVFKIQQMGKQIKIDPWALIIILIFVWKVIQGKRDAENWPH